MPRQELPLAYFTADNSYHAALPLECRNKYNTGTACLKAEHLYSALHGIQTTLKRSGMDHADLPAINTIPALTCTS